MRFVGQQQAGTHTARFGEIEQRGMALTRKGRALYDQLLARVREIDNVGSSSPDYEDRLRAAFVDFPDDLDEIRRQQLAFFRYLVRDEQAFRQTATSEAGWDVERLIADGAIEAFPIVYEDFLPVSAAGIFQSNLGGTEQKHYQANAAQQVFEEALQARVQDEIALYARAEADSLEALQQQFRQYAA